MDKIVLSYIGLAVRKSTQTSYHPEEIQDDETWDMDPFLFTDTDDTFNNNMIITSTNAK